MKNVVWATSLALFLASCALVRPAAPLEIVWNQTYQATCSPPPIKWDAGAECTDATGTFPDAFEYKGSCYWGLFWPTTYTAEVVWRGSYSQSAFAHELLHAWQWCRGVIDYEHAGPEWKTLLPAANENLEVLGW